MPNASGKCCKSRNKLLSLALALSCLLLIAGCKDHKAPETSKSGDMAKSGMATRSLYDRLGGEPAITAVAALARTRQNAAVM